MRLTSQAVFLSLTLFLGGAACGRKVRLPKPPDDSTRADAREIAKAKNQYLKKIAQLGATLSKLNQGLSDKRMAGYNTSEAETLLKELKEGIDQAKDLLYWDKFEELNKKLENLNQLVKQARDRVKHAPKFGNQPIKKERIERKYLDDRDWVRELRGEPDSKSFRYSTTVYLRIQDATVQLEQSDCWDPRMNQFILRNPPTMESWYYIRTQTMYVFSEKTPLLDQFLARNDLPPMQRDFLLVQLCERQETYGGLELIYAGPPVTDLESIMQQVFAGEMRMAGMFGMEGMERRMKAMAALPDLTVAALAFNTSFYQLNLSQAERQRIFYDLMLQVAPELLAPTGLVVENDRKLGKAQAALLKKQREAIVKILNWPQTMNPAVKDIDNLVKLFPSQEEEIRTVAGLLRDTLLQLRGQFDKVSKDLMKFVTARPELLFRQDEFISIFCLLEGVRFEEKTLTGGTRTDVPDLSVKVLVKRRLDKYDDPVAEVSTPEVKITNANRYIEITREYRKLTSFGLVFPYRLAPGRYEVTIMVTDNLRVKTTQQEVVWTIVAPEEEPRS